MIYEAFVRLCRSVPCRRAVKIVARPIKSIHANAAKPCRRQSFLFYLINRLGTRDVFLFYTSILLRVSGNYRSVPRNIRLRAIPDRTFFRRQQRFTEQANTFRCWQQVRNMNMHL